MLLTILLIVLGIIGIGVYFIVVAGAQHERVIKCVDRKLMMRDDLESGNRVRIVAKRTKHPWIAALDGREGKVLAVLVGSAAVRIAGQTWTIPIEHLERAES